MSGGRRPDFKVYATEERDPENQDHKPWTTRIGSAWKHKTGGGINIELQALPVNNRIVMFVYDDEDAKEDEAKKSKQLRKK